MIEGMQLIAKDKIKGEYTSSDPYVIISIVDASGSPVHGGAETRPVSRSLMPVWDQDFALWVPQGATAIVFTVMDKDPGGKQGDDFMGQALVTGDEFRKLAADSGAWEGWRKLEQRPGRNERVSGKIRISLKMDPNALMEKEEGGPSFGIDMFQPTRRDSVTRLDFDLCNKFNTFKGMFKGEPCRIWVSDEGVAAFGQHVKLRLTWNELTSVTRVEQPVRRFLQDNVISHSISRAVTNKSIEDCCCEARCEKCTFMSPTLMVWSGWKRRFNGIGKQWSAPRARLRAIRRRQCLSLECIPFSRSSCMGRLLAATQRCWSACGSV